MNQASSHKVTFSAINKMWLATPTLRTKTRRKDLQLKSRILKWIGLALLAIWSFGEAEAATANDILGRRNEATVISEREMKDAGNHGFGLSGDEGIAVGGGNVAAAIGPHHSLNSFMHTQPIAHHTVAMIGNGNNHINQENDMNGNHLEQQVKQTNNGGTVTWDSNVTSRSTNSAANWFIEQCAIWQRPHHLYYQLANAFFLLAFLAPHRPFGMLWLRSMLAIGCVLLGMYGYLIGCFQDVVFWSGLFLGVNLIYMTMAIVRLRPVRFEKEIEAVYVSLFKPLRVSRHQFKKILNCMKNIRSLKYQEVYAQEKVTKVDSLSLVLSGKLVVSQNQRALHIVFAHQFLDSPEWFGVSTDDYFQVSIMAMEESRVLIWHRDKLKLSIMAEPFLQTVFDHILGRDVVKKLMQVTQVSESIASNGFIPSAGVGGMGGLNGNCYSDDNEDKQPMLVMKKTIEGHGLTALINRQLQEEHAPLLGYASYANSHNTKNIKPITSKASSAAADAAAATTNKGRNNYRNKNYNNHINDILYNNAQSTSPC